MYEAVGLPPVGVLDRRLSSGETIANVSSTPVMSKGAESDKDDMSAGRRIGDTAAGRSASLIHCVTRDSTFVVCLTLCPLVSITVEQ